MFGPQCSYMGTPSGPKYILDTHMDPLRGLRFQKLMTSSSKGYHSGSWPLGLEKV